MLSLLPPELLMNILSYLPLHSDAIRPYAALIPLLSTSHHFYHLFSPLLNSSLHFRTNEGLDHFLSSERTDYERLKGSVRRICLSGESRGTTPWNKEGAMGKLVKQLFSESSFGALIELKLEGMRENDAEWLVEMLKELGIRNEVATETASLGFKLQNLSIGFEASRNPDLDASLRNGIDEDSGTKQSAGEVYSDISNSTETFLSSCLLAFPNLQRLRVTRLPTSSAPVPLAKKTTPTGIQANSLVELEILDSSLSDSTLLVILQNSKGLQRFSLRNCTGLTFAGLLSLDLVLPRLESLSLIFNAPDSTTPNCLPSSLANALRGPPSPNSRYSPTPTKLRMCPPQDMPSILDTLLPSASKLRHLFLTGPLVSLPALRSILLSSNLPNLKTLGLNRMSWEGTDPCEIREVWLAARAKEIMISGAGFEIWKNRMDWVEDTLEDDRRKGNVEPPRKYKRAGRA